MITCQKFVHIYFNCKLIMNCLYIEKSAILMKFSIIIEASSQSAPFCVKNGVKIVALLQMVRERGSSLEKVTVRANMRLIQHNAYRRLQSPHL